MPEYLPFVNSHATVVPPYGIMKPLGLDANGFLIVTQPDADDLAHVMVNGKTSVGTGAYGDGTFDNFTPVSFDANDGIPVQGERWGVKSGNWYAKKDRVGFMAIADGDGESQRFNAVRVAAPPGGSPPPPPPPPWRGGFSIGHTVFGAQPSGGYVDILYGSGKIEYHFCGTLFMPSGTTWRSAEIGMGVYNSTSAPPLSVLVSNYEEFQVPPTTQYTAVPFCLSGIMLVSPGTNFTPPGVMRIDAFWYQWIGTGLGLQMASSAAREYV